MAYRYFKDSARRTASDKVLRDKGFNIAKTPKYNGYQRGLDSTVYKFFDEKSAGSGVNIQANNEHPLDLKLQNYINQLLEHLKKEQFIQDLKTIFGVLI